MAKLNLSAASHILAGYEYVIAAWVFGSAQEGLPREGGDVDIAVLFESRPTLDQLCELRAALQDTLQFDNIDLVTLNGASSILRFEALSGRCLFCRDDEKRATFASLAAREYEDHMALMYRHLHSRASGRSQ